MANTSRRITNGTKARKSRNELIRAALGVYLKQRKYVAVERFRKSDLTLIQSSKQFIFNKMIKDDITKVNSFLYSNVVCLSNNYATVELHFSKFVQFIQSQRDPIKEELSGLFGPLVAHLYIELLKGREWKPACEFLKNHAHLIAPVENLNAPLPNKVNGCSVNSNFHEDSHSSFPAATTQILFSSESTGNLIRDHFKNLIQTLSTCLRIESFESNEVITLFRSSKYELEMSLAAINTLKRYLDKQGHVIILNILQTWVNIEISDLKDENDEKGIFVLEQENENRRVHMVENGINSRCDIRKERLENNREEVAKNLPYMSQRKVNTCLRKLRHSAFKLQRLNTQIRTLRISDPDKQLATAALDSRECHMVAGFDNSLIRLWQLNRNTSRGRNFYRHARDYTCDWNTDPASDDSSSSDDDNHVFDMQTFSRKPSRRSVAKQFMEDKYEGNSFDDSGGISLHGHSKGVTDVLFSRHPLLLTVSKDLTMRAWKASDYSCGAIYRGHNYPIWCVCENPIGMYLATGSRDKTARLWSIDRSSPVLTYVGHTQDVDSIAFHPNGNYLATGSTDLSVRLWCVTSGRLFRVFTDCRLPVSCVSFSPDGKYLAAAGEELKVRIFDLAAGSQLSEMKDHSAPVTSIAWSPNGNKFASSCADGSVRVWDVSRLGITDSQAQYSSTLNSTSNKPLWQMSGCARSVKVLFNTSNTVSCIGR